MDALTKLKSGDWNTRTDEGQLDGSVIITLTKRGEGKVYRLHVRDLYGPDEKVLSDTVEEVG